MRREIFLHLTFWFSFFVFVTLINKFFNLNYWPLWVGGLFGTILPDIDHILYLYIKPQELTSQRVNFLVDKGEIKRVFNLLYETRGERVNLIFHTVLFQIIFVVLTFWIITSSGSLFGKGLVLAFYLHLLIDQIVDLIEVGNFSNWLKNFPWNPELNQAKLYWLGMVLLLCLFGFLL